MTLTRRDFLGGLLATVCCSRARGDAAEPLVRIGFLSDVHLTVTDTLVQAAFEKTLKRFVAQNVDAVVCAGDLLDTGSAEEMELALASWNCSFPNGKANDGRSVVPFFVWGNHDYLQSSAMLAMTPEQLAAACSNPMIAERDRWWRGLTGDGFPGEVFHRKVRGISFVGAHWGHEDEAAAWMTAHASEVNTALPFIHVQHPHPARTVCGDTSGSEVVRSLLARYPNCLSLSGHSHYSLAKSKAFWQGEFTALTGSVAAKHSVVIDVFADRIAIAPYDEQTDSTMTGWTASGWPARSGAEASSAAGTLSTVSGNDSTAAMASPFDSCDRMSQESAAQPFTSVRPEGTTILVK